jgi:HlyD family secretion protein
VARLSLGNALDSGKAAVHDGLALVPGMPAEVHIRTGDRTAMSYFLKPLADQFARAFTER